jgi:hypothetical protein
LRLADPARLEKILRRARDLIANCSCQTRGRTGCHKCLYNSVGRRDIPFVSRHHALGILDEILTNWGLVPAPDNTITGINLSKVRQSELERMFKVLLQRWSDQPGVHVAVSPDPAHPIHLRFDVRFDSGAQWTIREQVHLHAHGTIPDFYAERVDRPGTAPVAIYLDGWEFHGANPDDTDADAVKRAGLRAAGIRVWTLTWADVDVALKALAQQHPVAASLPLPTPVRVQARQQLGSMPGGDREAYTAVDRGTFDQLMFALRDPDQSGWRNVAQVVAVSAGAGITPLPVADLAAAVDAAAGGGEAVPANEPTGRAVLAWHSVNGQAGATFLDQATASVAAVCSLDTTLEPERPRWADWLHLGNVLQYLDEYATITTTRMHGPGNAIEFPAAGTPASGAASPDATDDSLYDDIFDATAVELAKAAAAAGFTDFVVGESAGDPDDTPVEVLWNVGRVGIVAAGVAAPDIGDGWIIKPADAWTIDELIAALGGGET